MPKSLVALACVVAAFIALPAAAQDQAWVERSNALTQQVIAMQAEFQPEGASQSGLEQYDGKALDLGPNLSERFIAAEEKKLAELRAALAAERDPNVRQDIEILIDSLERDIEGTRLSDRLTLDWYDVPQIVFGNLNALLDDQVAPARRAKAVELLQRYTGLYQGTTALTQLARDRYADSRGSGKVGPYEGDVEDALSKVDTYISGIRALFEKYQIAGAEPALAAMERQFADYSTWTRSEILPIARADFRQPPEIYAFQLKQYGIDLPPEELVARARRAFFETRAQMDALAPQVAAKFGFAATDYPSVLAELKKRTIPNAQMEAHYAEVLGQIQQIAARERIVTLPDYPVLMRLGSDAENAASPAPHMNPPRLIGNTGERGTFVLTTGVYPGATIVANDFNFDAAAGGQCGHPGRPRPPRCGRRRPAW